MQNNPISKKPLYRGRRWWIVGIYLLLLVWSGIYRYRQPERPVSPDKKSVFLPAVNGDPVKDELIRVTYKEFPPEHEYDNLPVILLHGSPGEAEVFDGIAPFYRDRRLIAVDLPGFGDAEKDIPDYSIRAHALYVLELLDKLQIEKAHVVGFSLGGGVALELAATAPEKIASISLVSSIGVQEFELLGNYHLNHAVHGVQLAFFWALAELTPNFGLFAGALPYARNFYDTDQRPLREVLAKLEMPVQIIHGKEDPLVPVEAAREHYRLVPQSELTELEDDHFMIFRRPEKIARPLGDFWTNVENETAKTRQTADPDRLRQAAQNFQPQIISARGATAFVYFLILAGMSVISTDAAALSAGIWTAQGRFGIGFALAACLFGAFFANVLTYLTGRLFGRKLLRTAPLRFFIKESAVEKFSVWLKENQLKAVFRSSFLFGFRRPVYFTAGVLRINFLKFLFGFLLSAALRIGVIIGLSFLAAKGLVQTALTDLNDTLILFGAIFTAWFLIRLLRKILKGWW